jgi:hypothetical protein
MAVLLSDEFETAGPSRKLRSIDWKIVATSISTLCLAKPGGKAEPAFISTSADTRSKLSIFRWAAAVLITLLGGSFLSPDIIPTEWVQCILAAAFFTIGVAVLIGKV